MFRRRVHIDNRSVYAYLRCTRCGFERQIERRTYGFHQRMRGACGAYPVRRKNDKTPVRRRKNRRMRRRNSCGELFGRNAGREKRIRADYTRYEKAVRRACFRGKNTDRLYKRLRARTENADSFDSLEVEKKEFSLSETARKEILILQDKWESKNIEVEAELNEVTVISNPELVGQMILNVMENAVKYTPENGKITVTDGKTADGVFLTIKDDGIGMDDETKRRMFDRYYRGDKSRQKGGNGLGLATVKKIAEVLGVKISVNTAPDEGTEFTFIF